MWQRAIEEAGQAANRKDWARAEKVLKSALAKPGAPPVVTFVLGKVCFAQGKLKQATTHFRKACEAAPQNPEAWFELGRAHSASRAFTDAQMAYERAVALAPKHLDSRRNAAQTALAAGNWVAAAGHFRVVRQMNPQDADAWVDGYVACLEARDPEAEAIRAQLMEDPAGRAHCLNRTVRASRGRIPLR